MTRVNGPLFGLEATGQIAGLGAFRKGRHGPEFIEIAKTDKPATAGQRRIRACFKTARETWAAIPPKVMYVNFKPVYYRDPTWLEFWADWLNAHPECR